MYLNLNATLFISVAFNNMIMQEKIFFLYKQHYFTAIVYFLNYSLNYPFANKDFSPFLKHFPRLNATPKKKIYKKEMNPVFTVHFLFIFISYLS